MTTVLPASTGRRRAGGLLSLVLLLTACAAPRHGHVGPLPVRNQHPVQLTGLRMLPKPAALLEAGGIDAALDLSYSSLWQRSTQTSPNLFRMDGEILRIVPRADIGLGQGLQFGFALPLAHTSGGFLDHFVEEWHDVFGFENGGRRNFAENQFQIVGQRLGADVYRMEERKLELMDIPLELLWQAYAKDGLSLALRAGLELPTGDADRGYGNEGVDFAVGGLASFRCGAWAFSAHLEQAFVHTPDLAEAAGIEYGDNLSLGFGVEAYLSGCTALLVQVERDQPLLRNLTGVRNDEDQWLLWTGLRTRLDPSWALELTFGEDLTQEGPPDFTAFLGVRWIPR